MYWVLPGYYVQKQILDEGARQDGGNEDKRPQMRRLRMLQRRGKGTSQESRKIGPGRPSSILSQQSLQGKPGRMYQLRESALVPLKQES